MARADWPIALNPRTNDATLPFQLLDSEPHSHTHTRSEKRETKNEDKKRKKRKKLILKLISEIAPFNMNRVVLAAPRLATRTAVR